MPKSVKHRSFGLRKGLFTRFALIALNAFLSLAVFYHIFRHDLLIILTCFIHAKCANYCYLHLSHGSDSSFSCAFFSYSTKHSQEGDHPRLSKYRKATMLQFLHEANLIGNTTDSNIISLQGASLWDGIYSSLDLPVVF